VLFAHGSPDPGWAEPAREIERRVGRALDHAVIRAAFLRDTQPDIFQAVEEMAGAGCVRIVIAPMFLAAGAHSVKDFPDIGRRLAQRHPGVRFEWTEVIGKWDEVLDALSAALIKRLAARG